MKTLLKCVLFIILTSSLVFAKKNSIRGFNKSFDVSSKGTLSISLKLGNVNIETWNKAKINIISKQISKNNLDGISITRERDNIEFNYNISSKHRNSGNFTFIVPENFNIISRTNSGNIELTGKLIGNFKGNTSGGRFMLDDIDGNVVVFTGGGNLTLQNIGGNLEADTYGGDIEVEDVKGNRADIKTHGGSINIGNVKGELYAHTYGGDIRVGSAGNNSEILTNGGDIKLVNGSGYIQLNTNGGDIKIYNATGFIEAKTSGGDIILKNIKGGAKAKTNAGTIYAKITPSGNNSTLLSSHYGDIELKIPGKSNILVQAKIKSTRGRSTNHIDSDFNPVNYKEESNSIRASYKIGSGKNKINISTASSNIKIKKIKTRGRK